MKIIVCEKCYTIQKITILNRNQIKLEFPNCDSITLETEYFNKFIKVNEEDDLFILPNYNFKNNHLVKAILYCFKCGKYIYNDCLKNHDEIYQGKGHITIKQKIYHQYYCTKKGHEENILNRFCLKCNKLFML